MAIGNPTSSGDELVIGECELSPQGLAWINQFSNSVPNSVRTALELFIMIHGREFRIGEFITWLENYAALIQDELLHGTSTAGATGGSDYMSSRERAIRQRVGESLTQGGGYASNPLVEVTPSSSDESSNVRPRRLLTSQEATLPTRNTEYLQPRQASTDSETSSSQPVFAQAQNQQQGAITPSQSSLENLPEQPQDESSPPSEPNPEATSGYLYLLENPSFPGWVKAGRGSTNSRFEQYNTADPHRAYRPIADAPVSGNLRDLERQLHSNISQRVPGEGNRGTSTASGRLSEWFRISREAAIQCLRDLHPDTIVVHTIPVEE